MIKENIAAISTPLGVGGIAIIRISGESCINSVNKYLKKSILKQEANSIKYNKFLDGNIVLDEVLVSIFKKPFSYTGEDIVEINCHGGIYVTNKILEILITDENIKIASPGEFSKIAFLKGKKNLIDIEAIMNTINAKNATKLAISSEEITNFTTKEVIDVRTKLMEIVRSIEVKMDYPEYVDIEDVFGIDILDIIKKIKLRLDKIKEDSYRGQVFNRGLKTVIIGAPNAGKSSLLNRLSNGDKAIVSEIEGTTRDVVESEVCLGKININLLDTAGIRETNEEIEKIGVEKSLKLIDEVELILLVIDVNLEVPKEIINIYEENKNKKIITILNKCDNLENHTFGYINEISISILNNYNIEKIEEKILEIFNIKDYQIDNKAILTNTWQTSKLLNAITLIDSAIINIENNMEIDIIEIDLKASLFELGEILGINVKDDLLNELFKNYCLGK